MTQSRSEHPKGRGELDPLGLLVVPLVLIGAGPGTSPKIGLVLNGFPSWLKVTQRRSEQPNGSDVEAEVVVAGGRELEGVRLPKRDSTTLTQVRSAHAKGRDAVGVVALSRLVVTAGVDKTPVHPEPVHPRGSEVAVALVRAGRLGSDVAGSPGKRTLGMPASDTPGTETLGSPGRARLGLGKRTLG